MIDKTTSRPTVRELGLEELFAVPGRSYKVPLYQREYAWGETEITKMLTDLWSAFDAAPTRNYYLGTLVVCPRVDGTLEVVDGQQRLTTLSLLVGFVKRVLRLDNLMKQPVVSFDSRQSVDAFLLRSCTETVEEDVRDQGLEAFVAAVGHIRDFRPSDESGDLSKLSFQELLSETKPLAANPKGDQLSFGQYLLKKVVLFEVTLPSKTDTMAYFEVMNNRGEQLAYHELLKARLLHALYDLCGDENATEGIRDKYVELSRRFDVFWTACSRMDGHVIDHLHSCQQIRDGKDWTDPCLDMRLDEDINEANGHERQSVIRDFSNFLMHVIRLYRDLFGLVGKDKKPLDIPLDERSLKDIVEDNDLKINPVDFLQLLICTRLEFDRLVVKVKMSDNAVQEWRLKEVRRERKHYGAHNTFEDELLVRKLIKIESALQVSNASQRYKEWVYRILSAGKTMRQDADALLGMLERFAAARIMAPYPNKDIAEVVEATSRLGVGTPHLLLNVIDYLMWKESEETDGDECVFKVPRDFEFSYLNSVEHHHAQSNSADTRWVEDAEIQDIGNLYLTSTSENSSMGKLPAIGKVNEFQNKNGVGSFPQSPKRYWMYRRTFDKKGWTWKDDAQPLSQYVRKLMIDFLEQRSVDVKRAKDD